MRKSSLLKIVTGTNFLTKFLKKLVPVTIFALFLVQDAGAEKFPLPNVKGQLKKEDLKTASTMELQADQVSFNSADNKATARGNVVVVNKDQQLYCDELQLDRIIQQAVAQGHVFLDTAQTSHSPTTDV